MVSLEAHAHVLCSVENPADTEDKKLESCGLSF